jgi:cell division protein FtsN
MIPCARLLDAPAARPSLRGDRAGRCGTSPPRFARGGTLLGLFIGIALGLALAAGVAYWLMKAGNPYQQAGAAKDSVRDAAKEPARTAKAEAGAAEKPRFDFYKILPGAEEPKVQAKSADRPGSDKATADRSVSADKLPDKLAKTDEHAAPPNVVAPDKAAKTGERFWLQAGAFTSESDAENLKARLAFGGWEAAVQSATLPDKGIRYRVRLGPYDNTDELNRIKGELARRGFDVAVIKFDRAQ